MTETAQRLLIVLSLSAGAVACSSDAVDTTPDADSGDTVDDDTVDDDVAVDDPDTQDVDLDIIDADDTDTAVDADADDADISDVDADDADVSDADAEDTDASDADVEDTDVDADTSDTDASDPDVADSSDAIDDADSDVTDVGDVSDDLWIEIGTGVSEYAPFDADDDLLWTQGFQGGFHVWTGFRAHGFDPRELQHEWVITNEAGATVGGTIWTDALSEDADGVAEMYGVQVVLGPDFTPEMLEAEVLTVTVTIVDPVDVTFTTSTTFTSRCCEFL